VTAVLAGNDEIARRDACDARGRQACPDDISVVGFDDVPYARFFSPALTTVRQDFKTLGKVAFHKLLELSHSAEQPHAGLAAGAADHPRERRASAAVWPTWQAGDRDTTWH